MQTAVGQVSRLTGIDCIRITAVPIHWWGEAFGKGDHSVKVVIKRQQVGPPINSALCGSSYERHIFMVSIDTV